MQTEFQTQQKELAALRIKQDQVAASIGVDSFEKIPQTVARLQARVREREEQVAGLRTSHERVAARVGVGSLEAIPLTVSELQQSIRKLQTQVEDVGTNVAALKGSCGSCQSPTTNKNACVACYAPCAQPTPCPTTCSLRLSTCSMFWRLCGVPSVCVGRIPGRQFRNYVIQRRWLEARE